MDLGPHPYEILFDLSEFQCSGLEMGKSLSPFRDVLEFKDIVCTPCGIQRALRKVAVAVIILIPCPVFHVCTIFSFLHGRMQPMRAFLSCWWETRLIFVTLLKQRDKNVSQGTLEKNWPW